MKILLLGPIQSTFVKHDIEILNSEHEVTTIDTSIGGGWTGAVNLAKCTFRSIVSLFSSDIVISWFADYTSLIPVLLARALRKKSLVIAGGFDVGYQPQLNYGAIMRPVRWFCVKNSFRFADKIIAVSHYAKSALLRLTNVPDSKAIVIHNCIKSQNYPVDDIALTKRTHFLTVSQAHSVSEYYLKGGNLFIDAARANPQYLFIYAGLRGSALDMALEHSKGLDNLQIVRGALSLYDELIPLYKSAYAYFQLSIEESFGVAVVEAMKCGCFPIISPNASLPEVAGKYGLIVQNDDELSRAISTAIEASGEERVNISLYADSFDIKYRKQLLLDSFN